MLQTVFVSSRTDIAGERVQDGRSGDWQRSLTERRSRPWYDLVCAIRGAEYRRCDGPQH